MSEFNFSAACWGWGQKRSSQKIMAAAVNTSLFLVTCTDCRAYYI